jgi:hypothetical protein
LGRPRNFDCQPSNTHPDTLIDERGLCVLSALEIDLDFMSILALTQAGWVREHVIGQLPDICPGADGIFIGQGIDDESDIELAANLLCSRRRIDVQ